jgi:hypothetical protein
MESVPMSKDEERIAKLADEESLEILWNALYSALEADLSVQGWPGSSKDELENGCNYIEKAIGYVKK